MAISAVTPTANTGGSTSGADFTLTSPAGTSARDLLIVGIAERQNTEGVTKISDANGNNFTFLRFGAQATSSSTSIWYRIVTKNDGSTWTVTNTSNRQAAIMAYRGSDQMNPIDSSGSTIKPVALLLFLNLSQL